MCPLEDQRNFGTFNGAAPVYKPAPASNPPSSTAGATGATGTTLDAIRRLTPRQREVLAVMMQGKCNKAICRSLNLAEPTVKNHVTAILKALKVTNRTEAVIKVARASSPSMNYAYTISGYSTFLSR